MSDNKEAEKKLQGQRDAIKVHINKYNMFPHRQDKEFALKTIVNAQNQIVKIKRRHPGLADSPLDRWKPIQSLTK